MKWMRERDLLIAQTMSFVQSVTGKKPDDGDTPAAPDVTGHRVPAGPIAEVEAVLSQPPAIARPPTPVPPTGMPRADLREDIRSEIRARVASFRAHQQRFLREREEYCSATMAKVRSALREHGGPARPDK
jgi:hypothetical protein